METILKNFVLLENALQRIRKYFSINKVKTLFNAFISSHFDYALLIWMFAGKFLISRVQKIHFRLLKMVHDTYDTTYDELFFIDSNISIHQEKQGSLNNNITYLHHKVDERQVNDISRTPYSKHSKITWDLMSVIVTS